MPTHHTKRPCPQPHCWQNPRWPHTMTPTLPPANWYRAGTWPKVIRATVCLMTQFSPGKQGGQIQFPHFRVWMEKLGEPKRQAAVTCKAEIWAADTICKQRPSIKRPYLARWVERASSSQGCFEPTFPVSGVGHLSLWKIHSVLAGAQRSRGRYASHPRDLSRTGPCHTVNSRGAAGVEKPLN